MAADPRLVAIRVLDKVVQQNAYADMVLDAALNEAGLSGKDSRLVAELVYGTLRWRGKLEYIIRKIYTSPWENMPRLIKRIIEMGLYQLIYMDKIPDYAAVNESVKLGVNMKGMVWGKVVNGVLREYLRSHDWIEFPDIKKDPVAAIASEWSHPEWLVRRWIDQFGLEKTLSICKANNLRPVLSLRVNRRITTREKLMEALKKKEIVAKASPYLKDFLEIPRAREVLASELLKNGLISFQDVSAGLVAILADPQPGEVILDIAAAPGGKCCYMGELSDDQSLIVASDLHEQRMGKVVENIARLKLKNVFPVRADGRMISAQQPDKILIDAPCTGFGVLRRRVDLRWNRNPSDIEDIVKIQRAMLKDAAQLLKPGGILIYATCTIEPEENENIIQEFLKLHPSFKIESADKFVDKKFVNSEGYIRTWPDQPGLDGSFAVRLIKTIG